MDKKYLTLENLLDRKSKEDKISFSEIDIDSLECSIKIAKIKTRKVIEILDKYDEDLEKPLGSYDMMSELIYKSVPILQKEDLKSNLNVPTPYEIVPELFNFSEMQKISEYILEMHGLKDKENNSIKEKIKNW